MYEWIDYRQKRLISDGQVDDVVDVHVLRYTVGDIGDNSDLVTVE
jgi:hypothetical protein